MQTFLFHSLILILSFYSFSLTLSTVNIFKLINLCQATIRSCVFDVCVFVYACVWICGNNGRGSSWHATKLVYFIGRIIVQEWSRKTRWKESKINDRHAKEINVFQVFFFLHFFHFFLQPLQLERWKICHFDNCFDPLGTWIGKVIMWETHKAWIKVRKLWKRNRLIRRRLDGIKRMTNDSEKNEKTLDCEIAKIKTKKNVPKIWKSQIKKKKKKTHRKITFIKISPSERFVLIRNK